MQVVYLDSFGTMLQNMLSTLFNSILAPVLRDVFNILQNIYMQLFRDLFQSFLLKLLAMLLEVIDFMEKLFNVFSGVSDIVVDNVSMPMIHYFFSLGPVQVVFGVVTMIAVVLGFLSTIIAVTKSISDMALEDKTPISTVLNQAVRAAATFAVVPICCIFVLLMTTKVMIVFNGVFEYDGKADSMSTSIFASVAGQAEKGTVPKGQPSKLSQYKDGTRDYKNIAQVKEDFDITKIDFFSAFLASILVAAVMLVSILQFIQRMFIITLLYIVSPFFVSYIPLDGGAKFKGWRDMFVAHMLSAFGPVICMKLYIMLVPVINEHISFGVTGTILTCVRLVFIVGGAFAVYRARFLFITIINPQAAGQMEESGIVGSFISGKVGKKLSAMSKGQGGRRRPVSVERQPDNSGDSASSSQSQAYTGK